MSAIIAASLGTAGLITTVLLILSSPSVAPKFGRCYFSAMDDVALQERLRALDRRPQRVVRWDRLVAAAIFAASMAGGVWMHEGASGMPAIEVDLSRAVIAAASARGVSPMSLWDDLSDRMGRRLDARQPNFGLSKTDAIRLYGIIMDGVYPPPRTQY